MHICISVFFLTTYIKHVKDNKTFENDYLMLLIKIVIVISSCNSQF